MYYKQIVNQLFGNGFRQVSQHNPSTHMLLTQLCAISSVQLEYAVSVLLTLIENPNYGKPILVTTPGEPTPDGETLVEVPALDRYQSIGLATLLNFNTYPRAIAYWDEMEKQRQYQQLQTSHIQLVGPQVPPSGEVNGFTLYNGNLSLNSTRLATWLQMAHHNVVADIRTMFSELGRDNDLLRFQQTVQDGQGRAQVVYNLPKAECLTLVAKYDTRFRFMIITRWLELENPAITQMAPYDIYVEMHRQYYHMQQALSASVLEAQRFQLVVSDLRQTNELLELNITKLKGEDEQEPLSFMDEDDDTLYDMPLQFDA